MAKTMTIRDPHDGAEYTLEFTRRSVELMEKSGFAAQDLERKPMSMIPTLFAGAFLAHHRGLKRATIDRIYAALGQKDELLAALIEMFNEPVLALMDEPEQTEGNLTWKTSW